MLEVTGGRENRSTDLTILGALAVVTDTNGSISNGDALGTILAGLDFRRCTSLGALVDGILLELAIFGEGIGADLMFTLTVASGTTAGCTLGGRLRLANVARRADLLNLGKSSWTFGTVVDCTSLDLDSSLALHRELGATNSVEASRASAFVFVSALVITVAHNTVAVLALLQLDWGSAFALALVQS